MHVALCSHVKVQFIVSDMRRWRRKEQFLRECQLICVEVIFRVSTVVADEKSKSWKINVHEKFKGKQKNTSWLATCHAGVRLNNSVIFTFTIKGSSSAFFLFLFFFIFVKEKFFPFQSHDYLCRQWWYGMVLMMVCSVPFRGIYRHIYIRKEVKIFQ